MKTADNVVREKSAGIAVFKKNKVLLVKHGPKARIQHDLYHIPSGSLEKGETYEQGAIRELEEETGLKVTEENLQQYPNNLYFSPEVILNDKKAHKFTFKVFFTDVFEGNLRATEETTPEWIELEDLDKYKFFLDSKDIIIKAKSFLKK